MDLGNVYHQILERIVRELIDQNKDWRTTEPKFTDSQIKHFSREIGESLRGELMLSTARNQYLLSRIEQTLTRVVAAQQAMLRRGGFQPRAAEVEFGDDGQVPALSLTTPKGNTVRLRGKIDRVDVLEDAASFAVIDYKLSDRPLALANVYHGLSLQLLTYLLVLQANGNELFGRPMTPAAAFYVKLLRKLDNVEHPDDAVSPDDPVFDLRVKPRGLFDGRFFQDIDAECQGGASEVVQAYLNKGGGFGRFDTTDVASQRQFDALLKHVRERIGELADELIGGHIEVRPYRIGKVTPCPTCDYRSVCRFEPGVNRYYNLQRMTRSEVFEHVDRRGGRPWHVKSLPRLLMGARRCLPMQPQAQCQRPRLRHFSLRTADGPQRNGPASARPGAACSYRPRPVRARRRCWPSDAHSSSATPRQNIAPM